MFFFFLKKIYVNYCGLPATRWFFFFSDGKCYKANAYDAVHRENAGAPEEHNRTRTHGGQRTVSGDRTKVNRHSTGRGWADTERPSVVVTGPDVPSRSASRPHPSQRHLNGAESIKNIIVIKKIRILFSTEPAARAYNSIIIPVPPPPGPCKRYVASVFFYDVVDLFPHCAATVFGDVTILGRQDVAKRQGSSMARLSFFFFFLDKLIQFFFQ